jgi:hypothetical protein
MPVGIGNQKQKHQEEEMKKFGIVLLSLGLIAAFSMSAYAADTRFTGEYYARGSYFSSPSLKDKDRNSGSGPYSYYDSRARFYWRIAVAEGLSLTTRMDALEQMWGSTATATKDNFVFENAFVTAKTKIGTFDVGHQGYGSTKFGTKFLDSTGTFPGIKYTNTFGPIKIIADIEKASENQAIGFGNDQDYDIYELSVEGKGGGVDAGIQFENWRNMTGADSATTTSRFSRSVYVIDPYVKAKIGPVNLEAEGYWMMGDWKKYESASSGAAKSTLPDVKVEAMGIYARATVNVGPARVGGFFLYMSGDDNTTSDKVEGGGTVATGPAETLKRAKDNEIWGYFTSIIFCDDYHDFVTTVGFDGSGGTKKNMDNVWMYALTAGVTPMKGLDIDFRILTAKADTVPLATGSSTQDKSYGTEAGVKASYNVFDNLTYNAGFAYLWTGDWYKGDEVVVACRGLRRPRKKAEQIIVANDYEVALAA